MGRLTAELISNAPQWRNPLNDWELDLRGQKIPQIENLGVTEDRFDTIDLSDNDVTKLDGFPLFKRISSIIINNNRVSSIADDFGPKLPSLETLILTNNRIENLADLDPLSKCPKLHTLSLVKNNVTSKAHYRLYVINRVPSLKVLDFRKVKEQERKEAKKLFGGKDGDKLQKEIASLKSTPSVNSDKGSELTNEQRQKIKDAILNAASLEEVQRLELILQSGRMPKDPKEAAAAGSGAVDAMDIQ